MNFYSFRYWFQVLSHGGYQGNDCQTAVIVFSACFLPDRSRVDYDYVMEHLFLWDSQQKFITNAIDRYITMPTNFQIQKQIRINYTGPASGRRLRPDLFPWGYAEELHSSFHLGEKLLPNDWSKAAKESEASLPSPSNSMAEGGRSDVSAIY